MSMRLPVPEGFDLSPDTSPADWIVDAVKSWGTDRVRLWSFLPAVFERSARVFHPIGRGAGESRSVRWADLAAPRGISLRPDIGLREVSGVDPTDQAAWNAILPSEGTMEREQVAALADLLSPFTTTPERCWIAAWEGWGSWGPGSSATLTATKGRKRRRLRLGQRIPRPIRRSLERSTIEGQKRLVSIPRVAIPNRAYFLLSARLDRIASFAVGGWQQAPNIWWPDDRAWCVVTEVDGYSTYVGGTIPCIDALLASDAVEAIEVPADVPMDPGPY